MGYYTRFDLEYVAPEDNLLKIELELALSRDGTCQYGALELVMDSYEKFKWYDHEEDMLRFSKEFPTVLFTLKGDGEESPDFWKKYFKDGKMCKVDGEIVYKEFEESMLK